MTQVSWENMLDSSEWQRILSNETLDDDNVNATNDSADGDALDDFTLSIEAKTLKIIGLTLSGIGMAFILGSWAFVLYFRNNPIVALGQPFMLSLVCFGSLSMILSIIFGTLYAIPSSKISDSQGSRYCMIERWLELIGAIVVQTTLVCKLYRVYKVTKFRRGQKVLVWHVLWPFLVVVPATVAVAITLEVLYKDTYEDFGEYAFCRWDPSKDTVVQIFNYAVEIPLTIAVLVFAWKLRGTNEQIGESRRIFYLNCFLFGLLVIFFVIGSLNWPRCVETDAECCETNEDLSECSLTNSFGNTEVETFIHIDIASNLLNNLLYGTATVAFLILPRVYYVRYEHVHGHLPEGVQTYGRGQVHVCPATAATSRPVPSSSHDHKAAATTVDPIEDGTESDAPEVSNKSYVREETNIENESA